MPPTPANGKKALKDSPLDDFSISFGPSPLDCDSKLVIESIPSLPNSRNSSPLKPKSGGTLWSASAAYCRSV